MKAAKNRLKMSNLKPDEKDMDHLKVAIVDEKGN